MAKPKLWKELRSKRRAAALGGSAPESTCKLLSSAICAFIVLGGLFVSLKWESLSDRLGRINGSPNWREGIFEGMIGTGRQDPPPLPPGTPPAESAQGGESAEGPESAEGSESGKRPPTPAGPSNGKTTVEKKSGENKKKKDTSEETTKKTSKKDGQASEGDSNDAKLSFERDESEKVPEGAWLSPQITQPSPAWDSPWLEPACKDMVSGPPKPLAQPLRTIDDMKASGQPRFAVSLPYYGLGSSLRRVKTNYLIAKFTGRHYVMLHAGRFYRVFDHLCQPEAFECSALQISWKDAAPFANKTKAPDPKEIEDRFLKKIIVAANENNGNYTELRGLKDKVITTRSFDALSAKHGLRDCIRAMLGGAQLFRTNVMSRVLNSVLSGGPSKALETAMRNMLRKRPMMDSTTPGSASNTDFKSAAEATFDIAIHVRTADPAVEKGKADCTDDTCHKHQKNLTDIFLQPKVWECALGEVRRLTKARVAKRKDKCAGPAIFLSTDSVKLRQKFVKMLSEVGMVYYSVGQVAHSALHAETGHLETMGEWYLLGKAPALIAIGAKIAKTNDPSLFALSAAQRGNASQVLVLDPYSLTKCADVYNVQESMQGLPNPKLGKV